ncbi:MAG: hypothetical protein ACRDTR_16840, partial [Rubrobacter sp.]
RTASWLAWSMCALSLALTGFGIGLLVLLNLSHPEVEIYDHWVDATVIAVTFSTVGALIASRRPEHPVGWLFCAIGLLAGVDHFSGEYATYALLTPAGHLATGEAAAWIRSWIWPITGALGVMLVLLFPDGKLPSPRWLPFAWLNWIVALAGAVALSLTPGPIDGIESINNPLGIGQPESGLTGTAVDLVEVLQGTVALAAAVAPFVRLRSGGFEERQKIKWFAYAATILIVGRLLASPATEAVGASWIWSAGFALYVAGIMSVPVAVGIAMFRHRLYDIDLLINRTLVYAALTASLVAVYFGGVAATEAVFRALTASEDQPQLVVVTTTLVIAALFNPLRRSIQEYIDRRFYRKRYDATKVLETFSVKARDETDLDLLTPELLGVVRETMRPSHVSLWLRADTGQKGGRQTD